MNIADEIVEMILKIDKSGEMTHGENNKIMKEIHEQVHWKMMVSEEQQTAEGKLNDIWYFLRGMMYGKGLMK